MGQRQSSPLEELDESLRRAAIAEQERMVQATAQNEAQAIADKVGAPVRMMSNSFDGTSRPIEPDDHELKQVLGLGDPMLGVPNETTSLIAANHICSAIYKGEARLLTPRIIDALDGEGLLTSLQVSSTGWCTFGTYRFFAHRHSYTPLYKPAFLTSFFLIPPMVMGPICGIWMAKDLIIDPLYQGETKRADEDFMRQYGFLRSSLLDDAYKSWWSLETGDGVFELTLKTMFHPLTDDEIIAKQIKRVLHRLIELDTVRDDEAKASALCVATVRSRQALNSGFAANSKRNAYRWEAALDVLQECCINHWDTRMWQGTFSRVCQSLVALPTLGKHDLRSALLEEMELGYMAEANPAADFGGQALL